MSEQMTAEVVYSKGGALSSHCRQYPNGLFRNLTDLIVCTKGRSNGMEQGCKGINPYVQEHIDMLRSITGDGPYINQGMKITESTVPAIMAREPTYSSLKI